MRNSQDASITPEVILKLLQCLLILSLLLPINVKAQEKIEITYTDTLSQALYRPTDETVEKLSTEFARQLKTSPKSYAKGLSCVAFAKQYLGIYGTWGNGSRNLSLNSNGQINDVVVFTYIHTAVVIGRVGEILTIIEGNYDNRGHIRTRTLSVFDPSIRGFHHF